MRRGRNKAEPLSCLEAVALLFRTYGVTHAKHVFPRLWRGVVLQMGLIMRRGKLVFSPRCRRREGKSVSARGGWYHC